MKRQQKWMSWMMAIVLCAGVATTTGCTQSTYASRGLKTSGISDPFEPANRFIFSFNNVVDIAVIEPAARAYNWALPSPARTGVRNFMRNMRSPMIIANTLLQGDIGDAGIATARFLVNTTVGLGGVIDVAERSGLYYRPEDFGQTLAVWGIHSGPYLVLPILGPSSLRDTTGRLADAYIDPFRYWMWETDNEWIYYTRNGIEGLDQRARLVDVIADMRRNSFDYYAAARSAYVQKREALIRNDGRGAYTAMKRAKDHQRYDDYDYPEYDQQ